MRVAFDSRPALDPRGIGRYASCLLDALRETAGDGDEIVEAPPPAARRRLPLALDRRRAAAPAVPAGRDAARRRPAQAPQRVPAHRASAFACATSPSSARRALIVPTAVVAAEVDRAPRHRRASGIVVIPEAPAPALHERGAEEIAAVRKRYGLPGGLPAVGRRAADARPAQARRRAGAQAPRELPLVLVGATKPWAHELPDVTLTGHVSDDDLAAIYSGARALVFPSDDEGFGLPTVEALACGTPVVASDLPVAARGARRPRDVRRGRRPRGPAARPPGRDAAGAGAAAAWTWADAARATWDVYERSPSSGARPAPLEPGLRARPARRFGRRTRSKVTRGPGGHLVHVQVLEASQASDERDLRIALGQTRRSAAVELATRIAGTG